MMSGTSSSRSLWVDPVKRIRIDKPKNDQDFAIHVLEHVPSVANGKRFPSVVLVHGFTQTVHSWDPLVLSAGGLCDRGYRAFCIDLRGHGKSSWSKQGDYSREAMVGDILAVVNALQLDVFNLIGLSMGGALVTKFTADNPKRVRSLVLVDWAPWPEGKPTAGVSKIASVFGLRWDTFEDAVDFMHSINSRRSRDNVALRMSQQLRKAQDGWRWNTDPAIAGHGQKRSKESPDVMWANVKKVACPALMIRGGESDVVPPEQAERMAQTLPKGQLTVVAGAGHSVIGDQPERSIAAIIPFIESSDASSTQSNL